MESEKEHAYSNRSMHLYLTSLPRDHQFLQGVSAIVNTKERKKRRWKKRQKRQNDPFNAFAVPADPEMWWKDI